MKTKQPQLKRSEFIPKPDIKQFDDVAVIDILRLGNHDIDSFIQSQAGIRMREIEYALHLRIDKAEMLEFLKKEIQDTRAEIENELVLKWYNMLCQKYSEVKRLLGTYQKNIPLLEKVSESEPDLSFLKEMVEFSLMHPKNYSLKKFDEFILKLSPLTKYSKRLESVLKDGKPHEAFFRLFLFVHHESNTYFIFYFCINKWIAICLEQNK